MTEPDEDTTIKEPPRQAAVIFAELLGITELYAGAGDAAALQATAACHDRLEQAASPAKARVLKRIGPRLMLLAESADEPATFYPLTADAEPPARVKLKLKYRGTKLVLKRIVEAVSLGRDPQCKVVIDDEHASRHHCTIQRRRDRFVLVDKSTNGTFVTIEGEQELALRRDEITLRKSGWICFGQSRSAGGDAMEFICD